MANQAFAEVKNEVLRSPESNHTPEKGGEMVDRSSLKRRPGTEKYKIQIQLSNNAKDRLFDLVDKTDAETAAQVVRAAIRVYDILIEELDGKGNELFLRDGATNEVTRLKLF